VALAAQLLLTTPLVRFVEVFCFEVSADVWECGREVEGFGELGRGKRFCCGCGLLGYVLL